jgi:uncharacterized membrane protein YedE/YeeE
VKSLAVALLSGILFGAGLAISGMGQPQRVLAFLDVTGAFDPSLAFVMIGAIGVHFIAQQVARRRLTSFLGSPFPSFPRAIDRQLIAGSAIFGLGWGTVGYCPGPAVVSAASGAWQGLVFVAAMAAGMAGYRLLGRGEQDECGGAPALELTPSPASPRTTTGDDS